MNRFLIINPFGIGDVLFTTPIIGALKDKYPESFIGYWCNQRVGSLLKNNPQIDKVFALSRGDIKRVYKPLKGFAALLNLIGQIRDEKFDTAFDFSLDSRYGFWSKLAGIKKRVGFDYKTRGQFLTNKVYLKGYSVRHVVEYYAELLRFIGIEPKDKILELTVSKDNSAKAKDKLAEYGIVTSNLAIGIAMGGGESWGKYAIYKQWPAQKFAELTRLLIKDPQAYVILLGSADEKPIADIVGKIGTTKNIIDLTGALSLEELAAIIKELKVLVCNDGGPLHMAAALGVKTVSIFGPVDEKVYGPYPPDEKHIVIKKDLACRPCYKNFKFNGCSNERKCLEDISVDEVFEGVIKLLDAGIRLSGNQDAGYQ